jgi:hypothetical protein
MMSREGIGEEIERERIDVGSRRAKRRRAIRCARRGDRFAHRGLQ